MNRKRRKVSATTDTAFLSVFEKANVGDLVIYRWSNSQHGRVEWASVAKQNDIPARQSWEIWTKKE